jgi:2-dehydro-3-deoxygluconokinase
MTSQKAVTFGEILLRLSPPGHQRLFQSPNLDATFGGGEANVAVSLARFGVPSQFVTRLPANAVGDAALRVLRGEGVDVSAIQRDGERIGIYFAETGASQRPAMVVYDRAHSALTTIDPTSIAWPEVLRGAAWFHTTGITPALGPGPAECTRAAITAARELGVTVSLDLNYRSRLWSEAEAQRVMRPLMRHVNVLIANEEHLKLVLGIPVRHAGESAREARGWPDLDALHAAAARVVDEHGVERVAITLRESLSASENAFSAVLYDGPTRSIHPAPRYVLKLIDRIGGGDSFAAGLIYALLDGRPPEAALRFGLAAGALKHSIPGDFNRVSAQEVDRLAAGDESGRTLR